MWPVSRRTRACLSLAEVQFSASNVRRSATKPIRARKPRFAADVRNRVIATASVEPRFPSAFSVEGRMNRRVATVESFTHRRMHRTMKIYQLNVHK